MDEVEDFPAATGALARVEDAHIELLAADADDADALKAADAVMVLIDELGELLPFLIREAKEEYGLTWQQIADRYGMSRQAAWKRFKA